jgi:hypothetical protein
MKPEVRCARRCVTHQVSWLGGSSEISVCLDFRFHQASEVIKALEDAGFRVTESVEREPHEGRVSQPSLLPCLRGWLTIVAAVKRFTDCGAAPCALTIVAADGSTNVAAASPPYSIEAWSPDSQRVAFVTHTKR